MRHRAARPPWAVLAATGLTPRRLAPSEYLLLPSFGIGLTDLVKSQSGSDAGIRFGLERARLRAKVLEYQPRLLCAPSTSGAARGAWDEIVWQDRAERVIRIRGPLG
jgi:TDG/mug DNA glycosylase family protein